MAKSSKPKREKKKPSALAAAASRKLRGEDPRYTPEQIAHAMMHAEERGEAERVPLDDGSWGWRIQGPNGVQLLKPTPAILEALDRFARDGHPAHDDE